MQKLIFSRSFAVLKQKPFALWGISLLCWLFGKLAYLMGGSVLFIGLAVTLLLETSMTMIYLHGLRGEGVKVIHLFDCFKDWTTIKRVLCGMGWMYLWIFLWALIPVVGVVFAVIRAYEYRLVPYILVTEQDISPTEAIKVSRERTSGYKGKMFWSDMMVYLIPAGATMILSMLGSTHEVCFYLFGIPSILISLVVSVIRPLVLGLIQAAYYEEITNPTVPLQPEYPPQPDYTQYYQQPQQPQYYQQPQQPQYYQQPQQPQYYQQPQQASPENSFCPNCGTPLTPGSTFCPNCGARL